MTVEALEFKTKVDAKLENKLLPYIYIFTVLHESFHTISPGDIHILIAFLNSYHLSFVLWH